MKDLYITVFIWLDIRKTNIGRKNLTLSRVCQKIAQYIRPSRVCLNIVQPDSAYHIILGLDQDKIWTITGHGQNLDKVRIVLVVALDLPMAHMAHGLAMPHGLTPTPPWSQSIG